MNLLKIAFKATERNLDRLINTEFFRRNAITLIALWYYIEIIVLINRPY